MAVRQYIGARYVPKFFENPNNTAEWLPNVIYEPLTIVTYGSNSYTSKKTVPASVGNPSLESSKEYWIATGNYNAQVAEYITLTNNMLNDRKIATPEYYGAAGNGIADDTEYVQDCIDNNNIVVLNGTYLITETVNLHKNTIIIGRGTILCNDRTNVINCDDDCSIYGITFRDNLSADMSAGACIYANEKHNITVSGVKFDTVGQGCCILCVHSEHITINHNVFTNYGYSGVMLEDSCKYIDIQFNSLYNSRYMGAQHSYPICFSGYVLSQHGAARFAKINYNYIEELAPHWEGIDSHGATDYEIIGNVITGTCSGISLGSKPTSIDVLFTDANNNCVIKDNVITCSSDNSSDIPYGIAITGNANCLTENVLITNNTISLDSANTATTAICSAISVRAGGSVNCVISNNVFKKLRNRHGIAISYGTHDNLIVSNNIAVEMVTTTPNEYYLINMVDIDTYENITISNNKVADTFTGIRFFNGPTVAPTGNKLIDCKDNDNKGLLIVRSTYTTFPTSAINATQTAKGISGQIIPDSSGTNAFWYCVTTGQWLAVSGTAV